MAYIAPTSKGVGDVITAATWNQDVVDNVKALKATDDTLGIASPSALGGVLYDSGTAWSRLAAGAEGTVLQAHGAAAPTFVNIQTDGMVNLIINPDGCISQRYDTTATIVPDSAVTYVVDRWFGYKIGAGAFSIQQRSDTPPNGASHYVRLKTTTADANIVAGDLYIYRQVIEGTNCAALNWHDATTGDRQPAALSFWARASESGTYSGAVASFQGDASYPFQFTLVANTWTLCTVSVPAPTIGTWVTTIAGNLRVTFDLGSGTTYTGTAGAWNSGVDVGVDSSYALIGAVDRSLDLACIQLVKGSVAPTYLPRSYAEELRLCQRYGFAIVGGASNNGPVGAGYAWDGTHAVVIAHHPVEMRAGVSVSFPGSAATEWSLADNVGFQACTALALNQSSPYATGLSATTGGTFIAGQGTYMKANAATSKMFLSCEL